MPGTKRPYPGTNGFKDATTDPDIIRAWWSMYPDANIGWYPHPSAHCVVDLDRGHDPIDLPPTRVIATPSGGEHHVFFGELPGSTSRLAPHVDTRGFESYVLLAPSMIDERDPKAAKDPTRCGVYKLKHDRPLAYVPWEFSERLTKVKPEPRDTQKSIAEIDTPERIERMRELAAAAPPANVGEGSNDATVELANRLLDWCTHEHVLDAMSELWVPRCSGEWTHEWLLEKVESIKQGTGRDSAIGCAEFEQPAYTPEPNESTAQKAKRRARFTPVKESEFRGMTSPDFWDPGTNVIPKDGIALIYGQPGRHKTNLTLTLVFDMMANGAKVIYAAGEGSLGVGKDRVPAHMQARGITDIDDKFAIVRAVPLLHMGEDVHEFIEAVRGFKPDIVVIDTLATATAGLEENSSLFSSLLTDNGPVGVLRAQLGCTVVIIAHEGKSVGKGVRGHSGLLGNVDAAIAVSWEKGAPNGSAFVVKMRDGKDGFSLFAKVNVVGVPVPEWSTREAHEASQPKAAKDSDLLAEVHHALKVLGAHKDGPKHMGVLVGELCTVMLHARGEEPSEHVVDTLRKKLDGLASRNPVYRAQKGARGAWLWAIPSEEEIEEE